MTKPPVLIVDDERRALEAVRRSPEGDFTIFAASTAEAAAEILRREPVHVVVCDQRLPCASGVDSLKRVRAERPGTVRILLAGGADAEGTLAGIGEAGIRQYLLEPWRPEQLVLALRAANEVHRLQRDNGRLSVERREEAPGLHRRVAARRAQGGEAFAVDRIVRAPGSPVNAPAEEAGRPPAGSSELARTPRDHPARRLRDGRRAARVGQAGGLRRR